MEVCVKYIESYKNTPGNTYNLRIITSNLCTQLYKEMKLAIYNYKKLQKMGISL